MTADEELERELRSIGAETVPVPDPQFVARLDAQLRAGHPGRRSPVWWRRPRLTVPLALGAGVAAAVLGLVLAGPPRAAVDTEGTGIAGQPATTIDVDDARAPEVTEPPPPGAATDEVPPRGSSSDDGKLADANETPDTTAPAPAPTPDSVPPPSDAGTDGPSPSTTTPGVRPDTTTTTTLPTSTTSPPDRRAFRADAVRRDPKTVVIRWTAFTSDRIASYRVVRRPPGGSAESSVIVAHQRATADRTAVDEIARDGEYVVQALDADGRVLARTEPAIP